MKKKVSENKITENVNKGKKILQYLQDPENRTLFGKGLRWLGTKIQLSHKEFYLYRIDEITFEEKAPRREALENVLGSLRGIDGINFIYMILGDSKGVSFYFGIAKDMWYPENEAINPGQVAKGILEPSIKGNFRGSRITVVEPDEKEEILRKLSNAKRFGILEGVPTVDRENGNENDAFQGVDRLIDVMSGTKFGLVVIAQPYTDKEIHRVEQQLYEIVDALSPLSKYTLQGSHAKFSNTNTTITISNSQQVNDTVQRTKTTTQTDSTSQSEDSRTDSSNQTSASSNETMNDQYSEDTGQSINDSDTTEKEKRHTHSSDSRKSTSINYSDGSSINSSCSQTYTEGKTTTHAVNYSGNNSMHTSHSTTSIVTDGKSSADAEGTSQTDTVMEQLPVDNKAAIDWIKYIDEVLFPRLDQGFGKGLFLSCAYLFSRDNGSLHCLANTAKSLYSGSKGNRVPLTFVKLDETADSSCANALKNLQVPIFDNMDHAAVSTAALSRREDKCYNYAGNWLSTEELGILAGLPQKEIIGLSLRKEVEFGLNVSTDIAADDRIKLGHLIQCGDVKENVPIYLDRKNLDKHTFVTGVTGSGKTTTCQNILLDCKLPFLVIEPAKTEYRVLKEKCPDLIFFTPGRQDIAPFFLNPFELFPGEAITSRADMLKATMEASFEMEAAIPQILEAGIYRAYKDKGWNIGDNTWKGMDEHDENGPFSSGVYAFPILSDFVAAVEKVTNEQGFDDRLRNDYIGSLKARIQGLMIGAKGMMLNTPRSIDFRDLVDRQVVIELEEIKSGTEKSLLMGFILTNLLQAVKYKHRENPDFQHITLVEEAHRLLSRYVPGDSLNKKQGVEVFADMLAEVRKYGESLIIVDQIPEKMTPEVLKNTSTKIVHKLFAKDDKEVIGNTMALEEDQKNFLSNLLPGRAIVFTQGWPKAVQVKVEEKQKTTDYKEIDSKEIQDIAVQYYLTHYESGILRGLDMVGRTRQLTAGDVSNYLWLMRSDKALSLYKKAVKPLPEEGTWNKFITAAQNSIRKTQDNSLVAAYLYYNAYPIIEEEQRQRFFALMQCIADDSEEVKSSIYWKKVQYEFMPTVET